MPDTGWARDVGGILIEVEILLCSISCISSMPFLSISCISSLNGANISSHISELKGLRVG